MENVSTEIAEQLRKLEPEERVELGEAMARLEESPEFARFRGVIEGVRQRKLRSLVADEKDREATHYARALGAINGIEIVQACIDTLKRKGAEANKELEQWLAGAAAEAP